jgi:hypothetical protein
LSSQRTIGSSAGIPQAFLVSPSFPALKPATQMIYKDAPSENRVYPLASRLSIL